MVSPLKAPEPSIDNGLRTFHWIYIYKEQIAKSVLYGSATVKKYGLSQI